MFDLLNETIPSKPVKRKFKDLPPMQEEQIQPVNNIKPTSSDDHIIEEVITEDKWPKFLGMTAIKAHIISSFPEKLKEGS